MKKWKLTADTAKTIRMFIKEHIMMALICVTFFVVYRELAGALLTLLILAFLILYATANALCHYGMTKFLQHEKSNTVTQKRLVGYSFLIGMPIYFLWFVFSLIPIIQYEVWMLTGLPVVIVTGLTLFSIADRWKGKKAVYWSIQLFIYLSLLIGGQLLIHFIL